MESYTPENSIKLLTNLDAVHCIPSGITCRKQVNKIQKIKHLCKLSMIQALLFFTTHIRDRGKVSNTRAYTHKLFVFVCQHCCPVIPVWHSAKPHFCIKISLDNPFQPRITLPWHLQFTRLPAVHLLLPRSVQLSTHLLLVTDTLLDALCVRLHHWSTDCTWQGCLESLSHSHLYK